ncbi:hypothetical protein K2173_003692 [Erythroxylum novogranatense]|uniref:Auxin-responsive protein n=1 Tax=Erythroxylum novogranatense TaxID=1862640 RepID=A0AAV8TC94_9ROSI|nr:hypothetical protein K2173_003692 [Erythroxylum novogranatense]
MMEGGLGLLGGGGSSGPSANESAVSKVEASSYTSEAELELGLGLSLGGGGLKSGGSKASAWGECGRILTAQDFPSAVAQPLRSSNGNTSVIASAMGTVSGTKRAAEPVSHEGGSPTSGSQVVGWPPIRASRMNSLVNQAKSPRAEDDKGTSGKEKSKVVLENKVCNGNKINAANNEKGHLGFVKVNMDGVPIGRKIDLNAHACYETLAQFLEEMFFRSTVGSLGEKQLARKPSILLNGSSEFVLTYEDKEGDWMLLGDVPWGMFLSSVRRLRIMRTSEANGLGS